MPGHKWHETQNSEERVRDLHCFQFEESDFALTEGGEEGPAATRGSFRSAAVETRPETTTVLVFRGGGGSVMLVAERFSSFLSLDIDFISKPLFRAAIENGDCTPLRHVQAPPE